MSPGQGEISILTSGQQTQRGGVNANFNLFQDISEIKYEMCMNFRVSRPIFMCYL